MPSVATILSSACTSGIGKVTNPVSLWQAVASLSSTREVPTPPPSHTPEVTDWLARVAAAGGATPSEATANALDDFIAEIAAIQSKMINVNPIVPDNLIAAGTPLIKVYGHNTWTNMGFVSGDLSINGITGDTSSYFKTGVIPSTHLGAQNAGITAYMYTNSSTGYDDNGVWDNSSTASMRWFSCIGTNVVFDCWSDAVNGRMSGPLASFQGYISSNRRTSVLGNIWRANSVTAHSQVAAVNNTAGSAPTREIYTFASNNLNSPYSPTAKQMSFIAIHLGLTITESATFYSAIQNLRVLLGGGYR